MTPRREQYNIALEIIENLGKVPDFKDLRKRLQSSRAAAMVRHVYRKSFVPDEDFKENYQNQLAKWNHEDKVANMKDLLRKTR